MTRQELVFGYSHEDLVERLDLPKDAVILSMYISTYGAQSRQFCFKISVDALKLNKYLDRKSKEKNK